MQQAPDFVGNKPPGSSAPPPVLSEKTLRTHSIGDLWFFDRSYLGPHNTCCIHYAVITFNDIRSLHLPPKRFPAHPRDVTLAPICTEFRGGVRLSSAGIRFFFDRSYLPYTAVSTRKRCRRETNSFSNRNYRLRGPTEISTKTDDDDPWTFDHVSEST